MEADAHAWCARARAGEGDREKGELTTLAASGNIYSAAAVVTCDV